MTTATASAPPVAFPEIDARQQDCITDEQARFFIDNGLLVIRNVLHGEELRAMQEQTLGWVHKADRERRSSPDFLYKIHEVTKKEVPTRVEYMIDKTPACRALLGHPFILRSVEKLQGRSFIPTWDSMVFKLEGAGAAVPWHRDDGAGRGATIKPIFNVDFYLDGSDITNCLWGVLGSNRWSQQQADETIARLNTGGFQTSDGAVPILMNPGDVIFHNILALHGSPPAQSRLRRVVYYEFRPAEIELEHGPHIPEYIPLKQRVLLACLRDRAKAPYAAGETAFQYNPEPKFAPPTLGADEQLETYRYPHKDYWRAAKHWKP